MTDKTEAFPFLIRQQLLNREKSDRRQRRHGANLGELGSYLAHVLIDWKLVARITQRKSRMVRGHYVKAVFLDKESPYIAHYRLLSEKSLVSRGAAQQDNLRTDKPELLGQERLASMDLLRSRPSVLGRAAFCDIADVVVLLGKSVAVDEILKELT